MNIQFPAATFTISCTNEKIWNMADLVQFLSAHQNQHIRLTFHPEAMCLKTLGLYDILDSFLFSQCDIYTENPFETHTRYNIVFPPDHLWAHRWIKRQPKIDSDLHVWTQKKLFLIFYRRPTANRIGIAGNLMHKYRDKSKMHFSWGSSLDELTMYEFDKLSGYCMESLRHAVDLVPHMPLEEYSDKNFSTVGGPSVPDGKPFVFDYQYHDDKGIEMYRDILVDLVSESHVMGETFYPTEKTFRPMWLKKPFIIFASRDYLCYLRQMGFRTFGDYWNEEYDGYEGRDRFIRIVELIDNLAAKSAAELESMYYDMQYTLEHNYNLLQSQCYNLQFTKIT